MHGWDRFYVSYRDFDHRGDKNGGKAKRKQIAAWRRPAMVMQFAGFAIGMLAIGLFSAMNIANVIQSAAPKL